MNKIKIGLVGEDTNDTDAIRNLLTQHYKSLVELEFIQLGKRYMGDQLNTLKAAKFIREDYVKHQPNLIIYIRDLDHEDKRSLRMNEFQRIEKEFRDGGHSDYPILFLLIQYAIEALILADLETANKHWNVQIELQGKLPKEIINPKQHIKKYFSEYKESHCAELFTQLRLITIQERHSDFSDFMEAFQPHLSA